MSGLYLYVCSMYYRFIFIVDLVCPVYIFMYVLCVIVYIYSIFSVTGFILYLVCHVLYYI